jgi:DnaJ-class molecular chaperone
MDNMASNSWAYAILGLNQRSNPDAKTIKAQFRTLSLKFHPDKNQGSDEAKAKATARFQDIHKAYEHLMLQKLACEEVIEEKATADRSETQPAKMKNKEEKTTPDRWETQPAKLGKRDRVQNGHFRQGDENKVKIEGRQARAMHRKSKQPICRAIKMKAHLQLKRREREEREQRAMETKKYAPKSRNKTTRTKEAILENPDDPAIVDVDVDVYRNLNAASRQMRGAKLLRRTISAGPKWRRRSWKKVSIFFL